MKKDGVEATEPTRRINVELLERVKAHILEEPRRYNQGTFGEESDEAPCGARACIAGWAVHLAGKRSLNKLKSGDFGDTSAIAQRLLGLTYEEAETLFDGSPVCPCGNPSCEARGWPERFARRWSKAKTPRGRARVAADFIDHIIKTGRVATGSHEGGEAV